METKLAMPVLAIGAEKAFGANVAVIMRNVATNVQEVVVPNAGHSYRVTCNIVLPA